MLGQAAVEPEDLLLALPRSGNVEALTGVRASEIHAAIARAGRLGNDLVLGAGEDAEAMALLREVVIADVEELLDVAVKRHAVPRP